MFMSARYEQSTGTTGSKDYSGKKEIKLHLRLDHHKKAYAAIKDVVVGSLRKTGNAEVVVAK